MKRIIKPFLLSFLLCLLLAIYDALIVEGLFGPLNLWQYISVYHFATWNVLAPCLIVLLSIATWSFWTALYSAVFVYCGWEDILYFLVQLKLLPERFYWLSFPWEAPTSLELTCFAVLCLGTVLVGHLIYIWAKEKRLHRY